MHLKQLIRAKQNSSRRDVAFKTQMQRHLSNLSRATLVNPFNPEFTIVIFIHYKPRIAVAILDL